jgi:ribose transport system substrate-binding protein
MKEKQAMTRRFFALFTLLIAIASLIAACGGAPTTTAPTAAPAGQPTAAPEGKKFTIGISNPFISSEYRTQMIQSLIEVNKEYMERGITNELVIESADTDVAGQIQQLQNLINKGVDAILVNPSDVNGLNDTLQEAINKGIIVISVDQELNTPVVYNVGIDQKEWAKISARWLAEKLGGQGNCAD